MFKLLKRKREITDLEKTEIIIEYLKDKIDAYSDYTYPYTIEPVKLLEIILDYEERKHFFITNTKEWNYINKGIIKGQS